MTTETIDTNEVVEIIKDHGMMAVVNNGVENVYVISMNLKALKYYGN